VTRQDIDHLWFRAMRESIKANEDFTRYRFAAMVAAIEREECAKMAEAFYHHGYDFTGDLELHEAIRNMK